MTLHQFRTMARTTLDEALGLRPELHIQHRSDGGEGGAGCGGPGMATRTIFWSRTRLIADTAMSSFSVSAILSQRRAVSSPVNNSGPTDSHTTGVGTPG